MWGNGRAHSESDQWRHSIVWVQTRQKWCLCPIRLCSMVLWVLPVSAAGRERLVSCVPYIIGDVCLVSLTEGFTDCCWQVLCGKLVLISSGWVNRCWIALVFSTHLCFLEGSCSGSLYFMHFLSLLICLETVNICIWLYCRSLRICDLNSRVFCQHCSAIWDSAEHVKGTSSR